MNTLKIKALTIPALALLIGMLSMASHATVVYNNFGPGDSFNTSIGYNINSTYDQGNQFTSSGSGLFTSLDVGMSVSAGIPPQVVSFNLYADVADSLGALLETLNITVNNDFGTLGTSSGLASGTTALVAGQKYWLIAHSVSGMSTPWNLNNIGDTGLRWVNGAVSVEDMATLRVNVGAVPEPSIILLLGSGLALIGFVRRKA